MYRVFYLKFTVNSPVAFADLADVLAGFTQRCKQRPLADVIYGDFISEQLLFECGNIKSVVQGAVNVKSLILAFEFEHHIAAASRNISNDPGDNPAILPWDLGRIVGEKKCGNTQRKDQ